MIQTDSARGAGRAIFVVSLDDICILHNVTSNLVQSPACSDRERSPEVSDPHWFRTTPKLPPNPVSDLGVSFGLRNYLRTLAVHLRAMQRASWRRMRGPGSALRGLCAPTVASVMYSSPPASSVTRGATVNVRVCSVPSSVPERCDFRHVCEHPMCGVA